MKKIVIALAAAGLLGAPVAAAPHTVKQVKTVKHTQNGRVVVKTRQVVKPGYKHHGSARRWARGQRFDSRYAHNYRVIHNPRAYRLNDAPRGYRYVQSGNDALLVGITSGLIGAVLYGALN